MKVRIINLEEKAKDIDGRTIRPGDIVNHPLFGKGQIESIDIKTYSIPFVVLKIQKGKFENEKIVKSSFELRKIG